MRDGVLVEVTGRTGGDFDLGGVGFIVANSADSSDALSFRVTPSGEYWLDRYSPQNPDGYKTLAIVHDGAIHAGFETPNRIGVLVRGSQYTFYVNGQFATSYDDDALRGGIVALYVDETSEQGTFLDVAVYPAG